ncbi:MAG TPA: aminotransferase class V-fold PLP-dependent enzyme [Micromonosporaceae bacterium]
MTDLVALPAQGVSAEQILAEISALRQGDLPTHGGQVFAYVFDPAVSGLDELANAAYAAAGQVNGLNPAAFPSLLTMENAVVGAAARLLGGGPTGVSTVVGNVTSGGTESLILAVKAARDARPEVADPELVAPSSAHAAFAKAARYLRVRLVSVPVSARSLRPEPAELAAAITDATVLVACSAPSYPHGVVDPVAEIAAVAAGRGVRCHVDACVGGWILPYLRRLGVPVPAFDFTVPGVTSISVDLHKYGYCPKGVSVLLHRDDALRASQYFGYADWPGYTVVNPTIASTRSGGPVASAFATLRHLGDEGYLRLAAQALAAARDLADAVRSVPGLALLPADGSELASTVVAFTSTDPALDLFVLADELAARGWHTQPQLTFADLPRSIHLTVTAAVAPRTGQFRTDLAEAAAAARALGPVSLPADLAHLVAGLSPAELSPDLVASLGAGLGIDGASGSPLPARQALINTLLDAAPVPVRQALLVAFLRLLQRPTG